MDLSQFGNIPFKPDPQLEESPRWAIRVASILAHHTHEASQTIDFDGLERELSKLDFDKFCPKLDSSIRKLLHNHGLPGAPADLEDPLNAVQSRPVDNNLVIDRNRCLMSMLTKEVSRRYSELFSRDHCAYVLGPSLVQPLFFECGEPQIFNMGTDKERIFKECEIDRQMLKLFAQRLTPEGFQGLHRELTRSLFIGYLDRKQAPNFDCYAEILGDFAPSNHIKFECSRGQLPLSNDIKISFFNMLTHDLPPPEHFSRLILATEEPDFFQPFDCEMMTEWFERGFSRYTQEFAQHRVALDKLKVGSTPKHQELEQKAQNSMKDFASTLDMLLHILSACPAFEAMHRDHVQNEDGTETPSLPLLLAKTTQGMLELLGHGKLPIQLDKRIPSHIAEAREFSWYLDDQDDEFFIIHVADCFERLIVNRDFVSAGALMIIAPSTDSDNCRLDIAGEFKALIAALQPQIRKAIVEQIGLTADFASIYKQGYKHEPGLPPPLRRELFEKGFDGLLVGIPLFVTVLDPKALIEPMTNLVAELIGFEPLREGDVSTTHRGFEMSHQLLSTLGREGENLAGTILAEVLKNSSVCEEFCAYLSSCNSFAHRLCRFIDLNGEAYRSADIELCSGLTQEEMPLYERRMKTACKLYDILPFEFKDQILLPIDCVAFLDKMKRGREIREHIDAEREHSPIQISTADLERLSAIQAKKLEHSDDASRAQTYGAPLAASIREQFELGRLKDNAVTRQLLIWSHTQLAEQQFEQLTDPLEFHSPANTRSAFFHIEGDLLAAFRSSLRYTDAPTIIAAASRLSSVYGFAAKHSHFENELQQTFIRLGNRFDELVKALRKAETLVNTGRAEKSIFTEHLSDFMSSYEISELMNKTFISA